MDKKQAEIKNCPFTRVSCMRDACAWFIAEECAIHSIAWEMKEINMGVENIDDGIDRLREDIIYEMKSLRALEDIADHLEHITENTERIANKK